MNEDKKSLATKIEPTLLRCLNFTKKDYLFLGKKEGIVRTWRTVPF